MRKKIVQLVFAPGDELRSAVLYALTEDGMAYGRFCPDLAKDGWLKMPLILDDNDDAG